MLKWWMSAANHFLLTSHSNTLALRMSFSHFNWFIPLCRRPQPVREIRRCPWTVDKMRRLLQIAKYLCSLLLPCKTYLAPQRIGMPCRCCHRDWSSDALPLQFLRSNNDSCTKLCQYSVHQATLQPHLPPRCLCQGCQFYLLLRSISHCQDCQCLTCKALLKCTKIWINH